MLEDIKSDSVNLKKKSENMRSLTKHRNPWSYFFFNLGAWVIPGSRTKWGAKAAKEITNIDFISSTYNLET